MVNRHVVMAVLFSIGFVGCAGASQSGLNPSVGAQSLQPSVHRVHPATVNFYWLHFTHHIPANQETQFADFCTGLNDTVINGANESVPGSNLEIGSYPYHGDDGFGPRWEFDVKNNGNQGYDLHTDVLCASQT